MSRVLPDSGHMAKEVTVPAHIIIEDRDDRPAQMTRDPDGYFARARQRAEAEVRRQAGALLPWLRRHHQH
jgi:hypothetical protein